MVTQECAAQNCSNIFQKGDICISNDCKYGEIVTGKRNVDHPVYFPLLLAFLPLPKAFPSKPGRDFFETPFFLSLRLSLRLAMLSSRFFCLAAIAAWTCSFFVSLNVGRNQTSRSWRMRSNSTTYHVVLLFAFSFSLRFAAFFSLSSSSWILTPSNLAPALAHFSFSSTAFRFSSGNDESFSLRADICCSACWGSAVVLKCCPVLDSPATEEYATEVRWAWGPSSCDALSATSSWV